MDNTLLRMKNVTKRFSGVLALDNAELELRKGEVHALIGENGAGKSTLMKILFGIYPTDTADIWYKGKQVKIHSSKAALEIGICMIRQEVSLVPWMSVSENIWLGREKQFSIGGMIHAKKRDAATKKLLSDLNIDIRHNIYVKDLSVAEIQLVELARAVSYNADLIIMDEPTSALSNKEVEMLFGIVRHLSEAGCTIVFISHKIEEIFKICTRVTIMRDGKYITTRNTNDVTYDELISLIVGREVTNLYPKEEAQIGDTALEVRHLSKHQSFEDVSFQVRKGEVLGFAGLIGAGRTEIMRTIFGIDKFDSGEVLLNGENIKINGPGDAIRKGIAMVTEDRLRLGIVPIMSVKCNLSLAELFHFTRKNGFIKEQKEKQSCAQMAERMELKFAGFQQPVSNLSGGNQQKVIIGRSLMTAPKVLILDEPTRGIDVGAKSEIHRKINMLAQDGVAIIMVSSELAEVMGMSDRIMVVREGRIIAEYEKDEFNRERIMMDAFGLDSQPTLASSTDPA